MIAFVRTAHIKPGKTGDTMKFAHAMGAFIKGSYGVEVELLRPIGGNPQRLAWSSRYADLAAMEAFNNKLLADAHLPLQSIALGWSEARHELA
jgi:hypothetical protein